MNTLRIILSFISMLLILNACRNKSEESENKSDFIEITRSQFNSNQMQLGEITEMVFEDRVRCNGTVVPMPNGLVKIFAPVSGIVKNIHVYNGQMVEKDQLLMEIYGNEFIDLQKDFAEASAVFKRLKNEYDRITLLYREKVTSDKEYTIIESEYKSAMASYRALKLKIESIGLSPEKIENAEFYSSYFIKSPIKGYVSNLISNPGKYSDSQTELMEIINPDMLQVKLLVFTADVSKIQIGLPVRVKSVSADNTCEAAITSTGIAFDNETKAVECYALLKNNQNFRANEYVEAEIITHRDTVSALPDEAIIKTGNGNFILVLKNQDKDKFFFRKVNIITGRQFNGFTELPDANINGLILTKGVYSLSP